MRTASCWLRSRIEGFITSTSGQDTIEYTLIAGFVAVVVAATFPTDVMPNIIRVMSKVSTILAKSP